MFGKPVHHIGLNWEELRGFSLPNPLLDSFQITGASQESSGWEAAGMECLQAAGLPRV